MWAAEMTLEDLHRHSPADELKQPGQELHGYLKGGGVCMCGEREERK